jgi:hypothetical protein
MLVNLVLLTTIVSAKVVSFSSLILAPLIILLILYISVHCLYNPPQRFLYIGPP